MVNAPKRIPMKKAGYRSISIFQFVFNLSTGLKRFARLILSSMVYCRRKKSLRRKCGSLEAYIELVICHHRLRLLMEYPVYYKN